MLLSQNKIHAFLVFALCNFILSPIHVAIFNNTNIVVGVNFSLVILAGYFLSERTKISGLSLLFGLVTIFSIWAEGLMNYRHLVHTRLLFSFIFYLLMCYSLAKSIIDSDEVDIYLIMDSVSGFLLIGFIGGILFETLELIVAGSFSIENQMSGYLFYYYSFITATSIGYGDIVPVTPKAKSIAIG